MVNKLFEANFKTKELHLKKKKKKKKEEIRIFYFLFWVSIQKWNKQYISIFVSI